MISQIIQVWPSRQQVLNISLLVKANNKHKYMTSTTAVVRNNNANTKNKLVWSQFDATYNQHKHVQVLSTVAPMNKYAKKLPYVLKVNKHSSQNVLTVKIMAAQRVFS